MADSDAARWLAETLGILVIAGVLLLAFGADVERRSCPGNLRNILVQISVVGVAAIGATIVLLAGRHRPVGGAVVLLGAVVIGDLDDLPPAAAASRSGGASARGGRASGS